jgi:hypothetical protein
MNEENEQHLLSLFEEIHKRAVQYLNSMCIRQSHISTIFWNQKIYHEETLLYIDYLVEQPWLLRYFHKFDSGGIWKIGVF